MADEPTGSLDHQNCELIMGLFKKLNMEGLTILLITHDQDVANQCDRIITIDEEKIEEQHYKYLADEGVSKWVSWFRPPETKENNEYCLYSRKESFRKGGY